MCDLLCLLENENKKEHRTIFLVQVGCIFQQNSFTDGTFVVGKTRKNQRRRNNIGVKIEFILFIRPFRGENKSFQKPKNRR